MTQGHVNTVTGPRAADGLGVVDATLPLDPPRAGAIKGGALLEPVAVVSPAGVSR